MNKEKERNNFSQTNIANLKGVSRSYINKIVHGHVENELTDEVLALFAIDKIGLIKEIFLDEETYNVCDACLLKSRSKKTLKHAVKIQQIREILLRAEGKEE